MPLMRPGRVVVDLVLDQDRAQMRLAEDQHAVEELAAQGTEEAFAGRVHPGSLNGSPQDPGAGGLEDGVEGSYGTIRALKTLSPRCGCGRKAETARELGLVPSTVHRWLNDGFIHGEQLTPGAPWRIRLTDDIRALLVDNTPDGWLRRPAEERRRPGRQQRG
jgi:hypothetical protein